MFAQARTCAHLCVSVCVNVCFVLIRAISCRQDSNEPQEHKFAPPLSAPKQPYGLWKPDGASEKDDKGERGKVVVKERAVRDGRREGILDNGAEAAAKYKAGERPKMSAEDKAKRLAEMQDDASRNENSRLKQLKELQVKIFELVKLFPKFVIVISKKLD